MMSVTAIFRQLAWQVNFRVAEHPFRIANYDRAMPLGRLASAWRGQHERQRVQARVLEWRGRTWT